MSQMKAAVRCNALDLSGLATQEKHGKRQDDLSKKRRVRDVDPILMHEHGGLDLRALYDEHVADAKMNSSLKKTVLHFLVRFPPELLEGEGAGRFFGSKKDRQKEMLQQACEFINRTHGGDAVFAARLDRDEEGETIVDVFASPKYEKRTKRTKADAVGDIWMSPTKFGKDLAEKHAEEIHRRHPGAKGKLTKPRHVGIALQSEFSDFFLEMNGVELAPKVEKTKVRNDRLEKEAHQELEAKRKENNRLLDAERQRVADEKTLAEEALAEEKRLLEEEKAKAELEFQEERDRIASEKAAQDEELRLDRERLDRDKADHMAAQQALTQQKTKLEDDGRDFEERVSKFEQARSQFQSNIVGMKLLNQRLKDKEQALEEKETLVDTLLNKAKGVLNAFLPVFQGLAKVIGLPEPLIKAVPDLEKAVHDFESHAESLRDAYVPDIDEAEFEDLDWGDAQDWAAGMTENAPNRGRGRDRDDGLSFP